MVRKSFNFIFFFLTIMCFSCSKHTGKYFSGTLDFKIKYEAKNETWEKIIKNMPEEGKFTYQSGSFKQEYKEGGIDYSIYNYEDKFVYYKFSNNDTLVADKISTIHPFDRNPKVEVFYNTDTLNGFSCDKIVIQTDKQRKTFIFNDIFMINPELQSEYKNDNRNLFAKHAKSLPMKYILENDNYKMTVTTVSWRHKKIDSNEFVSPNLPIKYIE